MYLETKQKNLPQEKKLIEMEQQQQKNTWRMFAILCPSVAKVLP